jgi:hypoxanthine phosphoribosyltransferase
MAQIRPKFTKARLATRVQQLGRSISKDYAGRSVDVVVVVENGFLFGADLLRCITVPVTCHFVRAEMRDIEAAGHARREIYFSCPIGLRGRDVLLVDAVLNTGVTQDFLLRRLEETRPRSLRLAVLFDKPDSRKVNLRAEYIGFPSASNYLVGYGLGSREGFYRNLPFVGVSQGQGGRSGGSRRPASRKRKTRG